MILRIHLNLSLRSQFKFATELNLDELQDYFNGSKELNCNDLIRAVETILKHGPISNGLPTERGIFPRLDEQEEASIESRRRLDVEGSLGKKVVFGHVQTIKLMNRQLNLVVDRAAHAFYIAENLDSALTKILSKDESLNQLKCCTMSILFRK